MAKYFNKKVEYDGILWDSKKELRHWIYLKEMEKAGIVKNLKRQVPVPFKINGKTIFKWIADFVYEDGRGTHYVDCKSVYTAKLPVFRLKKKLLDAQLGIEIEIV